MKVSPLAMDFKMEKQQSEKSALEPKTSAAKLKRRLKRGARALAGS